MDKDKLKIMMYRAQKGRISELNGCITCQLCKGYFIDATTIIECLHTFCRSCIVQYLESNKYCPICDVQVHKTKPLLNIRQDKTIQDLVYKLVPRLYHNEAKRRKTFYEANPAAKPSPSEENTALQYEYILAPDESINLTLNYYGSSSLPRYLRCPSAVSIAHLKKLIQAKYELTDRHKVDMLYNQDVLNPSLSLMDVAYIYLWKKKEPLALTYKIYECRAKKPKLEYTETSVTDIDRSANNNNWKEVQLRISENGEMSITGIQDASMLDLLDATDNFKNEIVINESKKMDTYHKPVQTDSETHLVDGHLESAESEPEKNTQETGMVTTNNPIVQPIENHIVTAKKELPELKFIGKTVSSNSTLSTPTKSVANTRLLNSGIKMVINNAKSGASVTKIINTFCSDANRATSTSIASSSTDSSSSIARTAICSSAVSTSKTLVPKSSRQSTVESNISRISFTSAMAKTVELSETLNLNSELSVIPLNASASCVSLSSCGTTTVFSTINKTMCSTKSEESYSRNSGLNGGNENKTTVDIEKDVTASKVQIETSIHSKESNNLKRKCDDSDKLAEVPAKLPKPTILNHSIGLMNLSNNHPLKKHSRMNRNGERRYPEVTEKIAVSSSNLTVGHVLVSQKPTSLDPTPSKPVIINKNLSYLNLNRSNSNKIITGQKNVGNVPCYMSKTSLNSIGNKIMDKNGEKNEEKVEGQTSNHNTMPKCTVSHSHAHSYQNLHHTPIITPSQLPHHQNLNCLQLKQHASSKDTTDKEDTENAKNLQNNSKLVVSSASQASHDSKSYSSGVPINHSNTQISFTAKITQKSSDNVESPSQAQANPQVPNTSRASINQPVNSVTINSACTSTSSSTSLSRASPVLTTSVATSTSSATIKAKPSTPIGYKTLRDPPKSWNSQINSQIARVNQTVKAQQLANAAAAAAASQASGANGQGRYGGDLKSVRPAKFFKGRNMPRYLGNPASGVKPMYQLHVSPEKEKQEQLTQTLKAEKSEIKKHSIVKIDPKTLKPISEKAPETSNLSNISSGLGLGVNQSNQELRINPSSGDLKINTSSVSIFNPLKLQQNSPKNDRKSPKSPHSPKIKSSSTTNAAAVTTSTSSPVNTLSPKQQRDKTSLTFTPPNPFVPNLASPTLNPNQFLFPAGGFPSYDPRFMAAYHSLWYTQRMAAAAAAGLVPPPLPHAFGLNIGLNPTTTIGQQPHSPGVSPKHSAASKSTGQSSSRSSSTTTSQSSKSSPTPTNKKTKESSAAKNEKSLETALEKLAQNKVKELGNNKHLPNDNKESSKDVRNGSPLHVPQKPLNSNSNNPMSENCLVDTQQKKTSTNDGINMSALEKLSQNKAIEILGNVRDASAKRSPLVQETDGNRSLATTNGSISKFSANQPTAVKNTLSGAHGTHNTSTEQLPNDDAKLQSHSKSKKVIENPEGGKTIEPFSSPTKHSETQNDKNHKVLDTRAINVSDVDESDKSSQLTSTEVQNRLGQLPSNLDNENKEPGPVQNSTTVETNTDERISTKGQTDESLKNATHCDDVDKIKGGADEKQCNSESRSVQISCENPNNSSSNTQSDSENHSNEPSKSESAEDNKELVEACNATSIAENDSSFSDIVSGKTDTTETLSENAENNQVDKDKNQSEINETSSSVSEKPVLAESDSGGGEKTNSV